MLKSMTGFGRAEGRGPSRWRVEARSVNNRFCEVVVRLPREWQVLERRVRQEVQGLCARGRVDVALTRNNGNGAPARVDVNLPLARQYGRAFRHLRRELGCKEDVPFQAFLSLPGILVPRAAEEGEEAVWRTVRPLLLRALRGVDGMRRAEGRHLAADLQKRMRAMEQGVQRISRRLPKAVQGAKKRLQARIAELAGDEARMLDQGRLAQETAILAERADITEELVRLGSHLAQARQALRKGEPVGRTLEFILQEMHREVNTIGSKSVDTEISTIVVQLKGDLEKLREQIQNVE